MPQRRPSTASRPRRIVELYSYRSGWQRPRGRVRLDTPTAQALRAEGFTMVRVRVSLRESREVSLIRFLDNTSSVEA